MILRVLLLPLLLALAVGVRAEPARSHQLTGVIVALTDNTITLRKGDDTWEISRSAATKTKGPLAVGSRVTVTYTMSAASIEVNDSGKSSSSPTQKADEAAQRAADKAAKKAAR